MASWSRLRVLSAVIGVAAGVVLLTATPAAAVTAERGQTYRGVAFQGRSKGPNVSFKVSADGQRIDDFRTTASTAAPYGFGEAGHCGGIEFTGSGVARLPQIRVQRDGGFDGRWESHVFFGSVTATIAGRFKADGGAAGVIHYRAGGSGGFSSCSFDARFSATAERNLLAAKCHPGRTSQGGINFDGVYRNGAVGGVYARIRDYSPWVHPGSEVSAWVMLEYYNSSTKEDSWAQIGWQEAPFGNRHTLVEYDRLHYCNKFGPFCWGDNSEDQRCDLSHDSLSCNNPIPVGSVGGDTYYTVLWDYVPGQFTFYVKSGNGPSVEVAHAPDDFTPNSASVNAETHDASDQMPGTATQPEIFDDVHVYINGKWQPFNGTPTSSLHPLPTGRYGFSQNANGTHVEVWDNACSHIRPGR